MSYQDMPARLTYVAAGEVAVSENPDEVMTALLGSCVSVCLYDPLPQVGGMNHLLLPVEPDADATGQAANTMETLVNPMMRLGARRTRLQAKIFGGARFSGAMGGIGQKNLEFVRSYLENENIPVIASSTGGTSARRIQFWPATGRVRMKLVNDRPVELAPKLAGGSDVELF